MSPDSSLSPPPSEVSTAEVVDVGRVDGPVVALAVSGAACFDEAVVEREVVAD